ncbi:LytR/AlgR family response regulator transcription factor [Winogradskyella jejuensis]|uniref:LytTr DNA-binding domain-containing protein n=1 Tax=Winogradskyella jejuensis TaxID=1089305 RepID=A0A1M5MEN2_9FLAO|nr:LytTR family DNA-binding domain-containing protein [Winogradskyella jejuensis]SHG75780.1 LytTr DNA-binding domain-containing protein [Winogradskyella jejuensis]
MRKDKLYLLTFLSLSIVFIIISSVAIRYFVNEAADKVLDTQLEFSKREAKQVAMLIGNQLQNGISKENVAESVQKSIENSNLDAGFVSVFNWSGEIVCHPDIKQLGQQISNKESFVSSVSDEVTSEDLYKLLQQNEADTDPLNFKDNTDSEVVYLYPVSSSDWIVGAHANTIKVSQQIKAIKSNFQIILVVMGFLFILSSVLIVRLIGSKYEKKLEIKNEKLSDEIINLSKLNSALDTYQQQVSDRPQLEDDENSSKKRILTYVRNELLPVATEDIAYVYTDTGITYVMCSDGKRTTSNLSLDELHTNLDSTYFFRANRQFIIAISSIDKIVKYGNNQLKILINPNSEVDIIISKNKAAEFKKWLNL